MKNCLNEEKICWKKLKTVSFLKAQNLGTINYQKGLIRNYKDDLIGYKTFLISDTKTRENGQTELKLPHKTCCLKKENAMLPQQPEISEKQEIENLITNEPDKTPQSDYLF